MSLNPFRRIARPRLPEQPDRPRAETASAIVEGDAARDRRDWANAARHYRRALDRAPSMAGIWVQLGHALKEQGDRAGGLAAYQMAWSLEPDVADTAIQLGHVFKLMNQRDDAISWYKRALSFGDMTRDAARELVGLGLDRRAINALRPAPSGVPAAVSSHILWDVTWLAHQTDRATAMATTAVWQLQIALAASDAGAQIEFVVADRIAGQFITLPREAMGGLLAGAERAAGKPCDHVRGAVLVMGCPWAATNGADIMHLQTAIMDMGLRPILFAPDLAPIAFPDWFARASVDRHKAMLRAFLPLISGIIATDQLSAAQAVEWASLGGRPELPVMPLAMTPAPVRRSTVGGRRTRAVALLPRDAVECRAMAAAWRQQAGAERLHLIGFDREAPAGMGIEHFGDANITIGMLGDRAYQAALADADVLLVPASRSDCDGVIADAFSAGCRVLADTDLGLYERWGASISYFAAFRNAKALAAQWQAAEGKADATEHPAKTWGQALSRLLQRADQFSARVFPVQVPVGVYHDMTTFGAADPSAAWRDGGLLRYGPAWGATTPDGCVHGPAPAILQLRLHDVMTETYVCRLLHRNPTSTVLTVRVASGNPLQTGQAKAVDVVRIPPGKHAWSQIAIPAATDGQATASLISIEIVAPGGSPDASALPVFGGIFVHPSDQDHLWYEFMDAASRCSFPSLVNLHR